MSSKRRRAGPPSKRNNKSKMGLTKPVVKIIMSKNAKSSAVLIDNHLSKHIDALNQILFIEFIYVTKANTNKLKATGIRQTPTLIYGDRTFTGIDKIIKVLTPPAQNKESFGYGITSPEEMLHNWQSEILDTREDDDSLDENDPEVRSQQIRQKMAAFQRRRPAMEGGEEKHKIKGGRKLKAKKSEHLGGYDQQQGDDKFLKDSGLSDLQDTPGGYVEDTDGELILEEYFLEVAKDEGKRVTAKHMKGSRYSRV